MDQVGKGKWTGKEWERGSNPLSSKIPKRNEEKFDLEKENGGNSSGKEKEIFCLVRFFLSRVET